MANLFLTPNYICMGEGALGLSRDHMKKLGTKALVVTDASMIKLNNVKKLTDVLDEIQIEYEVFSDVNCEPTNNMVDTGIDIYKGTGCNFLIGIGGGSPLDTMKAIGAVIGKWRRCLRLCWQDPGESHAAYGMYPDHCRHRHGSQQSICHHQYKNQCEDASE